MSIGTISLIGTPAQNPPPYFWGELNHGWWRTALRALDEDLEWCALALPLVSFEIWNWHISPFRSPFSLFIIRCSPFHLFWYCSVRFGPLDIFYQSTNQSRVVPWDLWSDWKSMRLVLYKVLSCNPFSTFYVRKNYTNLVGHKGWSIALFSSPCVFQCVCVHFCVLLRD